MCSSSYKYLKLQIRGGIEDNSKSFSYFSMKTYVVTFHDGSQNMFLWKKKDNYPKFVPVTPSYLEHWYCMSCKQWSKIAVFSLKVCVLVYLLF